MKRQVFTYHSIPLVIAALLFYGVYTIAGHRIVQFDNKVTKTIPEKRYFPNYGDDPNNEDFVRNALQQGNALAVFGSSEMSLDKLPAIPFNFFNSLGIPCIGLGHAGNQCFSIYSQLCSMGDIKRARIVIMLSPGWFSEYAKQGTSTESFLEFNDERFLYWVNYDSLLPDFYKNYIGCYIANRINDIQSPSAIIKLFNYRYLASHHVAGVLPYWPYIKVYEEYCHYKIKKTNKLYLENKYQAPLIATYEENGERFEYHLPGMINWDSLYNTARKDFALKCTNKMAITDEYLNRYMKSGELKVIDNVGMADNNEYKDFIMLVTLLKYLKTDAYFVIEPFNPYTYSNPEQMLPVLDSVKGVINEAGFSYFNMYKTSKSSYEKGTLNDPFHLGNLGWYKADSAIYAHFIKSLYE